jgi:predicted metalloenzyme YecM
MYNKFYQVDTRTKLQDFFTTYLQLVKLSLVQFDISKDTFKLEVDHLGLQVVSKEEFDLVHGSLSTYCNVVNTGIIHGRRNNIYKLNDPIEQGGFELSYVEIFEPKADADTYKLKLGIEHISFYSGKFDDLLNHFQTHRLPIAKQVDMHGSKFLKTTFINLVEVEFRNDFLYQAIELEKKISN